MTPLKTRLTLDRETIEAPNLVDRFDEEDLAALSSWCSEGYQADKQSRSKWESRNEAAMDLAMQIQKEKNFPWPNCSNVAFPLVTIGVMQFHARAYAAIVDGPNVAKYRVVTADPTGEETRRAVRIGAHMSWQLLEQDTDWEEQHDRMLLNIAVVGCAFKKSYFSGDSNYNQSDLVMARDLVVNYWTKSIESAPRKTHLIPLHRNDIYTRVRKGMFKDVLEEPWYQESAHVPTSSERSQQDNRSGTTPPRPDSASPFIFLEMHCCCDLDQDGYAEPYIITLEESSKTIVRIICRFDREDAITRDEDGIVSIRADEHFTKYDFIPSPDGGFYDMGFGVLLGPLNESSNSLINQLIDAGTMAVTAGGFLGRGAKIRGGVYTFAPLEWKRVDSTGDDLNKSIVPLPVREPSMVLYQLLSLLINYTQRISGSTDMMVGENPGQNTPAETSRIMVEQGKTIYNSIFKRIWRSEKEEFRKLYLLNGRYLPAAYTFGTGDMTIGRADYLGNPDLIAPVADPNVTSDSMRVQQATLLKQTSMGTPGYNRDEVERRFLRAIKVDAIDVVFPGSDKVPPSPDIKLQIKQAELQFKTLELKQANIRFTAELMEEQRMNNAKILEMQAQSVALMETVEGDKRDREINAVNAAIGVLKAHDDRLTRRIELLLEAMQNDRDNDGIPDTDESGGGVRGMAAAPGNSQANAIAGLLEAPAAGAME